MNTEIYDYVTTFTKKIKNKEDVNDVQQQVLLILCEKNLIQSKLDDGLKNYIKGIVFNVSTTLYNKFNYNTTYFPEGFDIEHQEEEPVDEKKVYNQLMSKIKKLVLEKYYKKNKSITKWKVFYLYQKGYGYKYIQKRLNISYQTAIEYNYQCMKEIKQRFKLIEN